MRDCGAGYENRIVAGHHQSAVLEDPGETKERQPSPRLAAGAALGRGFQLTPADGVRGVLVMLAAALVTVMLVEGIARSLGFATARRHAHGAQRHGRCAECMSSLRLAGLLRPRGIRAWAQCLTPPPS